MLLKQGYGAPNWK